MATLLELCSTPEKLMDIKNKLEENKRKIQEQEYAKIMERYRRSHIFDTYEDALDWLLEHKGSQIVWHCKTLEWNEERMLFKSYEQDYGLDGILAIDVVQYYTKEELLEEIETHKRWFWANYPEENGKSFWLDKYGKLGYVYTESII